jgi:hypothetical protein
MASKVNKHPQVIPDFQREIECCTNSVSATTTWQKRQTLIVYQRETGTGMLRNRS